MSLVLKKIIVNYILQAMMSWVPLSNHYVRDHAGRWAHDAHGYYVREDQDEVRKRYESTAEDIVSVAFDDTMTPMFTGADGRLKSALQLASTASFEGGFNKWVDDGTCNTKEFQDHARAQHRLECDGGIAWTIWQIHMYNYVIKDGTMTQAAYLENSLNPEDREWIKAHKDEIIHGKDLVANRALAAKVAYYLMYNSLHTYHNLCTYTGEHCSGSHPLASQRTGRAEAYLRAHPFTMPDEDTMQALQAASLVFGEQNTAAMLLGKN